MTLGGDRGATLRPVPSGETSAGVLVASHKDMRLVGSLLDGDESAFAALVDGYSPSMLRVAQVFVSSRAVAEEVVQETWLGVIKASTASRAAPR